MFDMCPVIDVVLVSLCSNLNLFHTFSSVSVVNFEHVFVSWVVQNYHYCKPLAIYVYLIIFPRALESL